MRVGGVRVRGGRGQGPGEWGRECLVGPELQFGKMRTIWKRMG